MIDSLSLSLCGISSSYRLQIINQPHNDIIFARNRAIKYNIFRCNYYLFISTKERFAAVLYIYKIKLLNKFINLFFYIFSPFLFSKINNIYLK